MNGTSDEARTKTEIETAMEPLMRSRGEPLNGAKTAKGANAITALKHGVITKTNTAKPLLFIFSELAKCSS